MRDLLFLLEAVGAASLAPVWLPLTIWTVLAAAVLAGLRWAGPRAHPLSHVRLLSATLAALPLGLVAGWLLPETPLSPIVSLPLGTVLVLADGVGAAAADVPDSVSWTLVGWGGASGFLAAGALVGLIRLIAAAIGLARIAASLQPAPASVQAQAERTRQSLGLRRPVRVCTMRPSAGAAPPFVFGLVRPTIVLPVGFDADLGTARLVLLHELAHVRHGDLSGQAWTACVRAVLLAHPLVHLIGRAMDAAREQACDAAVLAAHHVNPRRYGALLLAVAQRPAPPLAFAMASVSPLHQRLLAMNTPTSRRPIAPALALLLGFGLAVAPAVAQVSPSPARTSETPPPEPPRDRPEVIGGLQSVFQKVQYPEIAKRAGIEGSVLVKFLVQPDGSVSDLTVARTDLNAAPDGDDGGLVAEALRVTRNLRFEPADGQRAPVEYLLPYFFKLPGSEPSLDEANAAEEAEARIRPRVRYSGVDLDRLEPRSKNAFLGWFGYFPTYINESGAGAFDVELRYSVSESGRAEAIEFMSGDEGHAHVVAGLAGTMTFRPDARPPSGSARTGTLRVSYAAED